MESYPRQAGALVTVVAVEESHVVVLMRTASDTAPGAFHAIPAQRSGRSNPVTC
jgi:hypothetical protein